MLFYWFSWTPLHGNTEYCIQGFRTLPEYLKIFLWFRITRNSMVRFKILTKHIYHIFELAPAREVKSKIMPQVLKSF